MVFEVRTKKQVRDYQLCQHESLGGRSGRLGSYCEQGK